MDRLLKSNIKYFWYPIFMKYLHKVIIDINLLGKALSERKRCLGWVEVSSLKINLATYFC